MKKFSVLLILILSIFCLTSCKKEEAVEPETTAVVPSLSQMQAICRLATTECYYHNVAKCEVEDGKEFLFWKADVEFWVEYDGIVTLGIETNDIKIAVYDELVEITTPKVIILGEPTVSKSKTYSDKSNIFESFFTTDKYDEYEKAAIEDAQREMLASVQADKALFASAEQRAKSLLEDYVQNVGKATGKNYRVKWI